MAQSVLIVDDEPNIVLSLEFILRQAGFDVRLASNGDEALEAIREELPQVILLDVMMPRRNGYDVCRTIRQNPDWQGIHIIMLTAKGRDIEREKGMAMGADEYVTKPFSPREVLERVKRFFADQPA